MNVYSKVEEWLKKNYIPDNSWIYFNATPDIVGTIAMNTVPGDRITRKFIDGGKERTAIFAIDMISMYDNSGTSDVNEKTLLEVDKFMDWLETKGETKDFPDLGVGHTVKSLDVLTNTPSMLVNTQDMLIKYQFQVSIVYLERRK